MRAPYPPTAALLVGLVLAAASVGCLGGADAKGGLYVKDLASDELREVHVTFTKAQVMPNGSAGWVTVFDGARTIELLSLNASTAREKLADLSLAPGHYERLRIAVGDVRIVYPNGSEALLNVMGNVVTIAEDFTVAADGSLDLVVDFDLDEGVDLAAGTYTPVVEDVQKSSDDSDDDGVNDVEDADDDDDGAEDERDHDDDGDGADDDEETEQDHEDEEDLADFEDDSDDEGSDARDAEDRNESEARDAEDHNESDARDAEDHNESEARDAEDHDESADGADVNSTDENVDEFDADEDAEETNETNESAIP